jgi:RNA polymerase sigma-70 factor, ECF subfamily
MKNDDELMRAYIDGDSQAFRQIYEAYANAMYRFLLRKLKNPEDASDLVQASFLKFHRLRERYRPDYPLLQWLYVITRSELIDFARKKTKQKTLEQNWAELSQIDPAASLDIEREWLDMLEGLSDEAKDIVVSRALREDRFEEIAARLGKEAATIRQIFSRSKRRMRERLEKGEDSK